MEELGRAVATSPDTFKLEADCLVPAATLMSLCRGLIVVEEESSIMHLIRELLQHASLLALISHC